MGKNNAKIIDVKSIIAAGLDPKTGLPVKVKDAYLDCVTKDDIKIQLRILDEQNAVNRFTWFNLPDGLNSRLIERILYYKGQGMFFWLEEYNKFFFLPYALDGTIDVYGRFTSVTPLPFNGTTSDGKEKPKVWIQGLSRTPVYDVRLEDIDIDSFKNSCVLLKDYTEQYSQTNLPRQLVNDPILDLESEMLPFMRTALLSGTGISGMQVSNEDEQSNVEQASRLVNYCALTGRKWIAIKGDIKMQEFTGANLSKAEEYLLAMQSIDNYRLGLYGLDNGGLFQKKAHMLQDEQEMNTGNIGLVMRDSLQNRQDFCNIVNSLWGLDIWCEVSETVTNIDRDGDSEIGSDEDGGSNQIESEEGDEDNV